MEPELPTPRQNFEQAPVQYGQSVERAPLVPSPEVGVERGAERREQASEAAARVADAAPTLPPPVIPITTPSSVSTTDDTPAINDAPIVANDDDLIEKEWVDRAKKIIHDTKDNPYEREREVAKLQADYLQKRYGKELGAAE